MANPGRLHKDGASFVNLVKQSSDCLLLIQVARIVHNYKICHQDRPEVFLLYWMFEKCLILGQGMDRLGATEIIVTTCLSAREVEMAAVLVSKVFKVGGRHEILLRKVLKYCTLCGKQLVHKKSEFASINQHLVSLSN